MCSLLQWVPSPALYSPGAERHCLCPIRIQGRSPKLRFGRLSLYSLSWSFGFARCFAPHSSWRLGYRPCYQGLPPCSMVYGGPIGFPIDSASVFLCIPILIIFFPICMCWSWISSRDAWGPSIYCITMEHLRKMINVSWDGPSTSCTLDSFFEM